VAVAGLPSPDTKRWVIRRKAEVVAAVRGGQLSLEQACSLYALNREEFRSWESCIDRFGVKGLRTTRTQLYLNSDCPLAGQKKIPTPRASSLGIVGIAEARGYPDIPSFVSFSVESAFWTSYGRESLLYAEMKVRGGPEHLRVT
jgi:hypothetical protein